MRVCVTGGEGMIGGSLVRLLRRQGQDVTVMDLRGDPPCDLNDPSINFDGFDDVYHCADMVKGVGYASTHHAEMLAASTRLSFNVIEAARKAKVKRFLLVSSSCVYPDYASPVQEHLGNVGFPELANLGYGWAKRHAEAMTVAMAWNTDIDVRIVRPANVYGPSYDWSRLIEDMHFIPALIAKLLRGDKEITVWGGQQTRTFQYEDDTAARICLVMDQGQNGAAYNLGGQEITIQTLTMRIVELMGIQGVKVRFDPFPATIGPMRKAQSDRKLHRLLTADFLTTTELEDGLQRIIEAAKVAMGVATNV